MLDLMVRLTLDSEKDDQGIADLIGHLKDDNW